jgi:hypothetical protein
MVYVQGRNTTTSSVLNLEIECVWTRVHGAWLLPCARVYILVLCKHEVLCTRHVVPYMEDGYDRGNAGCEGAKWLLPDSERWLWA